MLINLRVTPETKARWQVAAARSGLTLSEWMRSILDEAAGEKEGFGFVPPPPLIRREIRPDDSGKLVLYEEVVPRPSPPEPEPAPAKPEKPRRTGLCEHRVPLGSYCHRCD